MTLAEEIRSRGYWRTIIHPTTFDEHRLSYDRLLPTVAECAVHLRGWDFPHIGRSEDTIRLPNACQSETDWQFYREIWRFTTSAQFLSLAALNEDWLERAMPYMAAPYPAKQPGALLGAGDTILRFTEIFEFAARLANALPGEDDLLIRVELHNMASRKLWMEDSLIGFRFDYVAHADPPGFERRYTRSELLANARDLAIYPVIEVFQRFGWTPEETVIRTRQSV